MKKDCSTCTEKQDMTINYASLMIHGIVYADGMSKHMSITINNAIIICNKEGNAERKQQGGDMNMSLSWGRGLCFFTIHLFDTV